MALHPGNLTAKAPEKMVGLEDYMLSYWEGGNFSGVNSLLNFGGGISLEPQIWRCMEDDVLLPIG